MAKKAAVPAWQRSLIAMAGLVIGGIVVACLYWAQVVFIPLALGVFLTFLLTPSVLALQRRGLGRVSSVCVVVALTALVLIGLVGLVAQQLVGLVSELPGYTENVKEKVRTLRELTHSSGTGGLGEMIREITGELTPKPDGEPALPTEIPPKVVVQPESTTWLSRLPGALAPALEPIGALALGVVLSVFMLLKREDLRNRFIRLIGHGRMTVTTKAVDEAGQRISRYLVMQLIVNGSYGLAWGLGLLVIGVDYALLWGLLAALLRYVPYIGAPIGAMLPIALSLITASGWTEPLLSVALLIILELVSNNVLEPWLYGMSIGVSEVAMLVAAAFWAFLWGPIGLVLSGPLTVCLVVLGRYVPALEFFYVLLGEEPALTPDVVYYQRLLAADQDEATSLVLASAKEKGVEQLYDELLIPALCYAKRDRERDDLTEHDEDFIYQATRDLLEDLGERVGAVPAEDRSAEPLPRVRLLACPARDEADHLGVEMLRQLLDPAKWDVEVTAVETLTSELVARAVEEVPAVICIGALPPGGLSHTRYLCKRLHARLTDVKILVGRWGLKGNVESNREQLKEAGADQLATTLLETRNQLQSLLPTLATKQVKKCAV